MLQEFTNNFHQTNSNTPNGNYEELTLKKKTYMGKVDHTKLKRNSYILSNQGNTGETMRYFKLAEHPVITTGSN